MSSQIAAASVPVQMRPVCSPFSGNHSTPYFITLPLLPSALGLLLLLFLIIRLQRGASLLGLTASHFLALETCPATQLPDGEKQ